MALELVAALIQRVEQTQQGFTDIRKAADELAQTAEVGQQLKIADALYPSAVHQARMLAVFIYGDIAAQHPPSLAFLKETVSRDPDWRVQEILAQAFDGYCAESGYPTVLPIIQEWLADAHPNVRRAVTEGLRIWTTRPYFKQHPEVAIQFLSDLKGDPSEYVRKSVGNALRDISRKHPDLIQAEFETWNLRDKHIAYTYKLASKFLTED